ncbi:uncharacterized protein LOC133816199 [Humulus lupulus]|uniref:uncharacterized protein LOC133816199 n=1 Tax=Humulus lupulus TaxID=3486 RepID=UPI002B4010BA|nr:uncharacterized protein LOC133816199 [Humulus lupulus]
MFLCLLLLKIRPPFPFAFYLLITNSTKAKESFEEGRNIISLIVIMSHCNTKVVEYLEPLMSKELLCKFPDNSAFDFDYSQSSIWSPLVPRAYSHVDLDSDSDFASPRNLNLEMGFELGSPTCSFQKVASKKKMTTGFALNLSALKSKTKNKNNIKKKLVSDFSSTPSFKGTCNPLTKKVWNKVLKAASKHFKKKKKDSTAHVRLFNYIRKENIC